VLDGRGLVDVELFDPFFFEYASDALVRLGFEPAEARLPLGQTFRMGELPGVEVRRAKMCEKLIDFHGSKCGLGAVVRLKLSREKRSPVR
jgi:hypothetical protein